MNRRDSPKHLVPLTPKLTVNDPSRAGSNVGKTDEKTEYQFFHVKCFVHSSDIASEHDPSLDKTEVENSTSFFCSLQDSVFSYDIWGITLPHHS